MTNMIQKLTSVGLQASLIILITAFFTPKTFASEMTAKKAVANCTRSVAKNFPNIARKVCSCMGQEMKNRYSTDEYDYALNLLYDSNGTDKTIKTNLGKSSRSKIRSEFLDILLECR